jgi:hypothetical protein
MFRSFLVSILAGLALSAPALPAAGRSLALTIYNNDLALVKDSREISLRGGPEELRFTDVAAQIDPTSVHFQSLPDASAVRILEQNFQYDLIGPDRLLQKYLDSSLDVLMKDGKLHSGKLLSYDGSGIVLQEADRLVSLERGQVQELHYGALPGGLVTRPTLAWQVEGKSGRTQSELSYLTTGISWHAEYVAVANAASTEMNLSGWVSLDNHSGASYADATLKLVAGDVRRVGDEPVMRPQYDKMVMMAERAAAPQFQEEGFFEYHLYTLTRPATVADREIKQLALFPDTRVKCRKVYTYDGSQGAAKVRVTLEAKNSESEGLGMPLPKGKVRVYQEDNSHALQFAGEDRIDHTPKDEHIRLYVGDAFDIVGERKQTQTTRISDRVTESSYEIKVRNHKAEAITVVIAEHAWGDWSIIRSSVESHKKDTSNFEFTVPVAKDGEAVVTYTIRTQY